MIAVGAPRSSALGRRARTRASSFCAASIGRPAHVPRRDARRL